MKIYCCYTPAHEVLFRDWFLPSLPNDFKVCPTLLGIDGKGDFLSDEFLVCIRQKIDLIINSILENMGQIIVWSDVDVVFLRSCSGDIQKMFESQDLDFAFQIEGYHCEDVNSGFMAINCSQKSVEFFRKVSLVLSKELDSNEQPIINRLLEEEVGLNWAKFSWEYSATSHRWPPIEQSIIFHANCTEGNHAVEQKKKQFEEVSQLFAIKKTRICVITPELVGPRKNSGIGTHVFYFSKLLAENSENRVTVLLTAEVTEHRDVCWKEHYLGRYGIELVYLDEQPMLYDEVGWFNQWHNLRSQKVFNWLKGEMFNICHFQDLNGDGFVSMQARNTGIAFEQCVFTCMLNGPNIWANQGMRQFADSPVDDALLSFAEKYSISECDITLFPSNYAIDWCNQNGWKFSELYFRCPYLFEAESLGIDINRNANGPSRTIVFFGRLEKRKGLKLFLDSLSVLFSKFPDSTVEKIVFLGAHRILLDFDSKSFIESFFDDNLREVNYSIVADLGHEESLNFIANLENPLVVIPSLSETLGYTIIESLELSFNVIASNVSAIPELFRDTGRLFDTNRFALASMIEEGLRGELPPINSAYCKNESRLAWTTVNQKCMELLEKKRNGLLETQFSESPLVSVCVPHFNYGEFLPYQLDSLANQTYRNLEILVVDDGSTDSKSRGVFEQMAQRFSNSKFEFICSDNQGLSKARNMLAERSKGEFIVFVDADNISQPTMIETFVNAITKSSADCVTCHMRKFVDDPGLEEKVIIDYYTPIGACIEAAPFVDPFGDANFIVRKPVFMALGGFRHVENTASEDWEFLIRLVLGNYSLDVVPLPLFDYRQHPNSNMRQTDVYDSRMRVLEPFMEQMVDWEKRLLLNCVGMYEGAMLRKKLGVDSTELVQQEVMHLRRENEAFKQQITCQTQFFEEERARLSDSITNLENDFNRLLNIVRTMRTYPFYLASKQLYRWKTFLKELFVSSNCNGEASKSSQA